MSCCFAGTTSDVIIFLICILQKAEYLQNEKRYAKKKNAILLYSEKPFKQAAINFYFIGTLSQRQKKSFLMASGGSGARGLMQRSARHTFGTCKRSCQLLLSSKERQADTSLAASIKKTAP